MKKVLLFLVLFFASSPISAYAADLIVSNPQYNPTTKTLSFHIESPTTFDYAMVAQLGLNNISKSTQAYQNDQTLGGTLSHYTCNSWTNCEANITLGDTTDYNDTDTYQVYINNQPDPINGNDYTMYTSQSFSFATPAAQIVTDPSSSTVTVGTPFYVDVKVESNTTFNAAQATVTISNDLDIVGDNPPSSDACNGMFLPKNDRTQHTYTFAVALMGGSSTSCTVRKLTILPNASGSYTIGLSNYYVKNSINSTDIPTTEDEGSVTINDGPTPTPTVALSQLVVTSHVKTYYGGTGNEYTLKGTYESPITTVYVDGSQVSASDGEWNKTGITLDLGEDNHEGDNSFTIYGSDGSNQTATQVVHVQRHLLGDINGDGVVDIDDASRLAVDYGKTENLTYVLSNMNYDQANPDDVVDITDLSILARNWTNL